MLAGHANSVVPMAFSPDGRWLATGAADNTARLWDLSAPDPGADPILLAGHEGSVSSVAFSLDGRWLATGSDDTNARLWRWQTPDLITELVTSVTYSQDERRQFGIDNGADLPGPALLGPLMVQAQGLALHERGKALARTGAMDESVALLEAGIELAALASEAEQATLDDFLLDPTVYPEPQVLAERILANEVMALVFAGRTLMEEGNEEEARAKFEAAAALDPSLDVSTLFRKFRP